MPYLNSEGIFALSNGGPSLFVDIYYIENPVFL